MFANPPQNLPSCPQNFCEGVASTQSPLASGWFGALHLNLPQQVRPCNPPQNPPNWEHLTLAFKTS